MRELVELWESSLQSRVTHPLIVMAAFNLDFLCIHPFRDGNGRVSRLLLLLQCYHLGYEAGRYISIERIIEQNKERYYETLEESSTGWHEAGHDPWPYINHLLFVLKTAYRELEERLERTPSPRGAKTEMVEAAINAMQGEFSLAGLERVCPNVSRDMIRRVLRQLQKAGRVECLGRGPGAAWRKRG
jgi:Fic family protein